MTGRFFLGSLGIKLLAPAGAVAVLLAAVIGLILVTNFEDFHDRRTVQIRERIQSTRASLLDKLKQANNFANLVAATPEVGEAVEARDHAKMLVHMMPLVEHIGLDLLTIYRPDGVVLARGNAPEKFGRTDEIAGWIRSVAAASGGGKARGTVRRLGDTLFLMSAEPVATLNEPVVAVVVAGFAITPEFLAGLKERSGIDMAALINGEPVAATVSRERLAMPVLERLAVPFDDVADRGTKDRATGGGTAREVALEAGTGFALAALHDESAELERFWTRLIGILTLVTVVSVAVLAGSVWLVLKTVIDPLTAMTAALGKLADGDMTTAIPFRERLDEVGAMARAAEVFKQGMAETVELTATRERLRMAKDHAEAEAQVHAAASEQIRGILFASPVPLVLCDDPGRILLANPAARDMLDLDEAPSREASADLAVFDLIADPAERQRLQRLFETNGRVDHFDTRWSTRQGRSPWGSVSLRAVLYGDAPALLIGIEDITERKQAEVAMRTAKEAAEEAFRTLQRTQQSLIRAEKMASLSMLVAGVAHEINTPVGIGLTCASFLGEKTTGLRRAFEVGQIRRSDMVTYLDIVAEAATLLISNMNRASELIQSFKQVAVDQTSAERRRFDLRGYIDGVLISLGPRLRQTSHKVTVDCAERIEIDGYPGALAQILTNFLINSVLHGFDEGQGGRLDITVRTAEGEVILVYADDGKGIPPENLPRVFEPFFTTRRGSGGTGLGLHIVYNLATQTLRGDLTVASEVGRGTVFTLRFPQVATG